LLKDTASLSSKEDDSLYKDLDEILKILWVILKKREKGGL
jgi:hypothetical protein